MNTIRLFLCLLINISCIYPLLAQYSTIQGKITDEQNVPLPYVTLQLATSDSIFIQGTTTDEQGNYKFTEVGPGNYRLFLSSVGYEQKMYPFQQENKDHVLSDIMLKSSSMALKEIEVKALPIVHLDDRMLVFPEKQQVRHAYTGYDLLDNLMLPGVKVDRHEGKVTTFRGDVTLYINGRKVDYHEVKNLRPRDIEKVEYFDAPTGKYAMDVASINYITKKYDTGGYVSADAKQTIGYLNGDYNAAAKVSHKNTSFTVWGGHRMQNYEGTRSIADETYIFPEYEINKHSETLDGLSRTNRQYIQASVENTTDRRTLMGRAGFTRNATPEEWQASQTIYSHQPTDQFNTYSERKQTALTPNLQLYGSFKIKDNQRLEANLNSSYSSTIYERTYQEDAFHSYTHAEEDYYNLSANLNYVLQMKNKQSLAVQAYHFYYNTSTDYSGDYDRRSNIRSNESLLFVEYGIPLGEKVSVHVGPGISSLVYQTDDGQRRYTLSPRLHFRSSIRPTNKQAISINISIGNITPQYNMLNTVEQNVDSFRIIRGNPNLAITKMYSGSLSYNLQAGNFNIYAFGSYDFNQDAPLMYYFTEKEKIVTSYRSDNMLHMVNTGIGVTWRFFQNLHINLDGYYGLLANTGGIPYSFHYFSGSAKINYYWKSLGVSAFFDAPSLGLANFDLSCIRNPINYGISMNWSYRNLWVEAGTNAPFSKDLYRGGYLEAFPAVYRYDKTVHDRTYQQMGWVKVAYTFDFGRKTARTRTDAGADIQSTILKAE